MNHIKDACTAEAAAEKLVPMIELVVSKMLQQSDFVALLSHHLPTMEEMPNLPENVRTSLQVANQMVTKDLRGESNFDNILMQVKSGQKEVILRVFHSDTSGGGKAVLQGIQEANQKLQHRSNKLLHLTESLEGVKKLDATSDMEAFVKLITQVTDLQISADDVATQGGFGAAKDLAGHIVLVSKTVVQQCNLDQSFNWRDDTAVMNTGLIAEFMASGPVKNLEKCCGLVRKSDVKHFMEDVCSMKDEFAPAAENILTMLRMAPRLSASHLSWQPYGLWLMIIQSYNICELQTRVLPPFHFPGHMHTFLTTTFFLCLTWMRWWNGVLHFSFHEPPSNPNMFFAYAYAGLYESKIQK